MYVGKNSKQWRWCGDNGNINSIYGHELHFQIIINNIGCKYHYKINYRMHVSFKKNVGGSYHNINY